MIHHSSGKAWLGRPFHFGCVNYLHFLLLSVSDFSDSRVIDSAQYGAQGTALSCRCASYIAWFMILICPRCLSHIIPNCSVIPRNLSRYLWDLSLTFRSCHQSRVFLFSSSTVTCLFHSNWFHRSSGSLFWNAFTSLFQKGASSSYATIVSGGPGSSAISIILRSATALFLFEKLVNNIQNGTFSGASYIPCAGSPVIVRSSGCICLKVISTLPDGTKTTGNAVAVGISNYFTTRISNCYLCGINWYNFSSYAKDSLDAAVDVCGAK